MKLNWLEPKTTLSAERRFFSNAMLKAMIIPLLIEQLLQVVVGLVDTLMVSYAGESVVSGVSLVTMVYTIFIFMFTAISSGGAVIVSQYLGKKDRGGADLSASQLCLIAGVFSLACTVIILVFGNPLLQLLYGSVTDEVMAACRTYLWITTLSFPANALYNAGAALYRSMGRTNTTMKVSVAMNLLNVIGNAIGVFALRAGAAGVAWPTTISWYFAAVVMMILCFRKDHQVSLDLRLMRRFDADMGKRILGHRERSFSACKGRAGVCSLHIRNGTYCCKWYRSDILECGSRDWLCNESNLHYCDRSVRRCRGSGSCRLLSQKADPCESFAGNHMEYTRHGGCAAGASAVQYHRRDKTAGSDHYCNPQCILRYHAAVCHAAVFRSTCRR